jgi:rubrerythrin
MSDFTASGQRIKRNTTEQDQREQDQRAIAKAARTRKSLEAHTAGDAAQRAINRHKARYHDDEVATLKAQIEQLDELDDEDSAKEYAIIKARFDSLAAGLNSKAANEANEDLSFTCPLCFEACKLSAAARILAPCGHGLCSACLDAHVARNGFLGPCPSCRAPVASVVTPYF